MRSANVVKKRVLTFFYVRGERQMKIRENYTCPLDIVPDFVSDLPRGVLLDNSINRFIIQEWKKQEKIAFPIIYF